MSLVGGGADRAHFFALSAVKKKRGIQCFCLSSIVHAFRRRRQKSWRTYSVAVWEALSLEGKVRPTKDVETTSGSAATI